MRNVNKFSFWKRQEIAMRRDLGKRFDRFDLFKPFKSLPLHPLKRKRAKERDFFFVLRRSSERQGDRWRSKGLKFKVIS